MDDLQDFPPQLRSIFGVFLLQAKLEETIDSIETGQTLTRGERHLLVRLINPTRMGTLAQALHSLPSTVTALADMLESKALVERIRDPEDRRAMLLQTTPAGAALRAEMIARASSMFEQITGLEPEKAEIFADLLDQIRKEIIENGFPEGLKL